MAVSISEPTPEVADTSNLSSYSLGAWTPAANTIVVVLALTAAAVIDGTLSGGSLVWNLARRVSYDGGGKDLRAFWAYSGASPASLTPNFDCTADPANGCIMSAFEIAGANVSLVSPIKQIASASASVTNNPTCSFGANMETNNAYIAAFGCNEVGAPTATQPAFWTKTADIAIATPDMGLVAAYRAGGETGTSVTFTDAGTFAYGILAIEFYVAGAGPTLIEPNLERSPMRGAFRGVMR